MAQIESGGSGRKTTLDVNLVPVIDLMSVLIIFLLITAVWSQVSLIQIGSSVYGKKNPNEPPPVMPKDQDIVVKVDIKEAGYVLTIGTKSLSIPKKDSLYDDETLFNQLKTTKESRPTKIDAIVSVADLIPYENLIKGMDLLLKSGFTSIAIATGGPN